MNEFDAKSLAILGRQPKLGLAELESLFGSDHVKPGDGYALLDIPLEEISFVRLGGAIKLARVLTLIPSILWEDIESFLIERIPAHLDGVPEGSFTLGVSVYKLGISVNTLHRTLMAVKKSVRTSGRPMRVVPNKALELNSAQVLHNKLTTKGAWELLLVRDGQQTVLAQTIFVQDIEAYAARDQVRPKRDPRVGMLPPKLAQMIINLTNPDPGSLVLDPFCGSGVILQEALLMGYDVLGTDNDPRMVDFARKNIEWLKNKWERAAGQAGIAEGDATSFKWETAIGAVASEIYLGTPYNSLPPMPKLNETIHEVDELLKKFLKNLAPQIAAGVTICLAVPAWRKPGSELIRLPSIDRLTDMGYNYLDLIHVPRDELLYFREDQSVARQLLRLSKA